MKFFDNFQIVKKDYEIITKIHELFLGSKDSAYKTLLNKYKNVSKFLKIGGQISLFMQKSRFFHKSKYPLEGSTYIYFLIMIKLQIHLYDP